MWVGAKLLMDLEARHSCNHLQPVANCRLQLRHEVPGFVVETREALLSQSSCLSSEAVFVTGKPTRPMAFVYFP